MSNNSCANSHSTAAAIASAGPDAVVDRIDAFLDDRQLTPEQVAEVYNRWSATYEVDLERVPLGYNNPRQLTDAFERFLPRLTESLGAESRARLRVLDVACGTGFVGERLHKLGFRRIDGVDGSDRMLEEARRKAVYENLYAEFISDRPLKCSEARTYDALLTTGSFCPNHLAPSCLRHLAAVVKPGGLVGIAMRKEFCSTDPVLRGMEPELRCLEAEGVWEVLLWEEQPSYYGEQSGMFYVMQVK